ncbi:hypothetical protein FL966_00885 [Caproiciproducens galactitolivorans]|uniref:Phage capsid family protein n=1 Tax=Caproiciproducens galactitolivorans TaxID=642589 RepID=A0A4Z0Y957_9FIRM|nr:hypothetical protein [Caproiciproducens galactitolivorans]QEY33727.1 hypothetical protein FL966_00885 [Caproiciproducens galactitolivorans]TGJ75490.1 hypothetical protein CAGA_23690 [Caproiciproducens galactitolivorans]
MSINTFAEKVTKFIPILDLLYVQNAKTSDLDDSALAAQFVGTNKIKLPKVSVDGAGTYDRDNGYVQGSAGVSWEEHTLQYDRGRKFRIDVIDNDEVAFDLYRRVASEYVRTKEVPEIDAVRFAEIYAAAKRNGSLATVVEKDLGTSDSILDLFDAAEATMNEKEVPEEGRVLYVTNTVYKMLKSDAKISRRIDVGQANPNIDRRVEMLDGITPIIKVPQSRFNSLIQLNDGKTAGQTAGGYKTITGNKPINFVYARKAALRAVIKRNADKIVTPDVNQSADAYDVFYRLHHDLIVADNDTSGIYIHTAATAQA